MGCGETRQTSFLKQSRFHNPHVKEHAEVKICYKTVWFILEDKIQIYMSVQTTPSVQKSGLHFPKSLLDFLKSPKLNKCLWLLYFTSNSALSLFSNILHNDFTDSYVTPWIQKPEHKLRANKQLLWTATDSKWISITSLLTCSTELCSGTSQMSNNLRNLPKPRITMRRIVTSRWTRYQHIQTVENSIFQCCKKASRKSIGNIHTWKLLRT